MLIKTKGYLIDRQDYGDFDEVITFINEHGLKFNCFCTGTRKIVSKNARNLDYGNYCEFEFFHATNHDKLSRLKKVTTISYVELDVKYSFSLMLINEYFKTIEFEGRKYFELYQKVIYLLISDVNDHLIMLFICINFYKLNGLLLNLHKCYYCSTNKNLSALNIENKCSVCLNCANVHNERIIGNELFGLFKDIQTNTISNTDLNGIGIFNIDDIKLVIKTLMKFIYNQLGLFCSLMNEI